MASVLILLVTALFLATSNAAPDEIPNPIRLLHPNAAQADTSDQTHLSESKLVFGANAVDSMDCESWRLAVETNNIGAWGAIPSQCEYFLADYMTGSQYSRDSKAICDLASDYLENLTIGSKDLWVFDIDETTLSNLPYLKANWFGGHSNQTYDQWLLSGQALVLPESLLFYRKLLYLGIKVAFITGRGEKYRSSTRTNLINAGYGTWNKLILVPTAEHGISSLEFKSLERGLLEKQGFRIIGNMGDQWSDITGTSVGMRTFKLPNPSYYIS